MITNAVAKLVSKVGSADVADLNLKKVFSHTSFNGRIHGNKKTVTSNAGSIYKAATRPSVRTLGLPILERQKATRHSR